MAEPDPTHPDPFDYRWFTVRGTLKVGDRKIMLAEGAHADDLLAGKAGKADIAERVRKHFATLYDDPAATWENLVVDELPPEKGFFDMKFPFDPPVPGDDRRSIAEVDFGDPPEEDGG